MTFRELMRMVSDRTKWVQARIIPTWQSGRPLAAPDDYEAFYKEGYVENELVASCIWEISTSASEAKMVVRSKKKDGTTEEAKGSQADALRQLLENPNPEMSTFNFLEQLFTYQQITGNWFTRKIRAKLGRGVVHLWPLDPRYTRVLPGSNGWVQSYKYEGVDETIPAEDVVHDPLRPHPLNPFWGIGPVAVLRRKIDLDNQCSEFLRVFFYNNATPSGLLKLKGRVEGPDRQRLKELWTKEHTGPSGWHSVSVLDADADYKEIGSSPDKLRLQHIWDHSESRICMAFGVPPILVGCTIGLNRSTFANYAEARKSFWQETLLPLYTRCAQRLTKGIAKEFGEDLVIEFDFSNVKALQEQRESTYVAIAGWNAGILTLNQTLKMFDLPELGEDGEKRVHEMQSAEEPGGMARLLASQEKQRRLLHTLHEHHKRAQTPAEKKALKRLHSVLTTHFAQQRKALVAHLEA